MTTFLIIALLAYNAWLACHLLSRPSVSKGQTASEEETKKKREAQDEAVDIVGKSRFKMEASYPRIRKGRRHLLPLRRHKLPRRKKRRR